MEYRFSTAEPTVVVEPNEKSNICLSLALVKPTIYMMKTR